MTQTSDLAIDWKYWLERWDEQQRGYLPQREHRFKTMIDVVEEISRGMETPAPRVMDLACGPGCVSTRLLERMPGARCVAVDIDPLLLAIGKGALGTAGGRIEWVEANLRDPDWTEYLPDGDKFDAVLTTTALHWLDADRLLPVYRDLAGLMREGGVLLNGDHLFFGPDKPMLRSIAENLRKKRQEESHSVRGIEDWEQWWEDIAREPGVDALLAERKTRFGECPHSSRTPIHAVHEAALLDASFREVDVIWQDLDNRILAAVR